MAENQQTEEIPQEQEIPEQQVPEENNKNEQIAPIPEWATDLKGEFDNKFNQIYQLIGNVATPSSQPTQVPTTETDETAKKVSEIMQRMEREKKDQELYQKGVEVGTQGREKYKDFDNKIALNPEITGMNEVLNEAIEDGIDGIDTLYHLVTQERDRLEKMKKMSPAKQIREFEKLQILLEKKKADQSELKNNPQVPEPLSITKNSGKVDVPGDLKSQMEKKFRKKYAKQIT